jgi:hypothetical protein
LWTLKKTKGTVTGFLLNSISFLFSAAVFHDGFQEEAAREMLQFEWLGQPPRTRMVPCRRIRISASLPRERFGVACGPVLLCRIVGTSRRIAHLCRTQGGFPRRQAPKSTDTLAPSVKMSYK